MSYMHAINKYRCIEFMHLRNSISPSQLLASCGSALAARVYRDQHVYSRVPLRHPHDAEQKTRQRSDHHTFAQDVYLTPPFL